LEAILKTIEKMEKREERKKEALARLEHSKKQQCKEKDVKTNDNDTTVANVAETVVDKEQKVATEVTIVA
jgi:ribose 1,5-bisphosphokinase PhnN